MAITRPKPKATQAADADAFISGAPDASSTPAKGVKKGNKLQISLTITPGLLAKVDEMAAQLGQSRAAVINLAIYRMVEHGVTIER